MPRDVCTHLDAGCDTIEFAVAVQIRVLHVWRSTPHVHSEEADALLFGLGSSTLVLWDDHNGGQAHGDVRVLVGRGLPAGAASLWSAGLHDRWG